jgi:exonuclease VII small subunit
MSEGEDMIKFINQINSNFTRQLEVLVQTIKNHEQIVMELMKKINELDVRVLELEQGLAICIVCERHVYSVRDCVRDCVYGQTKETERKLLL